MHEVVDGVDVAVAHRHELDAKRLQQREQFFLRFQERTALGDGRRGFFRRCCRVVFGFFLALGLGSSANFPGSFALNSGGFSTFLISIVLG